MALTKRSSVSGRPVASDAERAVTSVGGSATFDGAPPYAGSNERTHIDPRPAHWSLVHAVVHGADEPEPPRSFGGTVAPSEQVALVGSVTEEAIEREELESYRTRIRAASSVGFFVYLLFGITDYLVARIAGTSFWGIFSLRLLFEALIGIPIACILWLQLSREKLRALDALAYGTAATGVAVMCIPTGGVESDYYAGIMLVHVCRSAFLSEHWKQALLPSLLIVLPYPVVLVGGAFLYPSLAAQLASTEGIFQFTVQLLFILSNAVLVGWAGHAVWSLRRKVYESRALGRYRLERRIGTGGMGEVWSATHPRLRRRVAIKILRNLAEGTDSIRRFEHEVAATSQLSHPNTVRIFDYGSTEDGLFYYVMELLDGESLAALVRRSGPLPPARAICLVDQAARALSEAHLQGICHRDVKPENLFVTHTREDGDFVKVLDFGVAKNFADSDEGVTQTGAMVGTPDYLSPEVVLGRAVDARADVYALGAVLFFCLTGRAPFSGTTAGALLFSHINVRAPTLRDALGHEVDPELDAIVARCLEKDPERRYPDAGTLAAALASTRLYGTWRPVAAGQASASHTTPSEVILREGARRAAGGVASGATATQLGADTMDKTTIEPLPSARLAERVAEHPLSVRGRSGTIESGVVAGDTREGVANDEPGDP